MRLRARLLRILRAIGIAIVAVPVLLFAFVQFQQHLFRHRAERLLADFHSLEINRTSWPETQKVINHWHNWGYSNGNCSSTHCIFTIDLKAFWILDWFGWHGSSMKVRFLVDDGRLRSKEIATWVNSVWNDYDYPLGIAVRVSPNFANGRSSFWYETEMAEHPNYMVSRPGGCENCMFGWVNFTPSISNEELNRLTNFQLDCFTRRHLCKYPGDLLPSIASYHLYEEGKELQLRSDSACSISPATRARDAKAIVVVDDLSQTFVKREEDDPVYPNTEQDIVLPVTTLKGTLDWTATNKVTIAPFSGESDDYRNAVPESLTPGKRYILFLEDSPTGSSPFPLNYCDALADTPSTRSKVMTGIAQDSNLDLPEFSWW